MPIGRTASRRSLSVVSPRPIAGLAGICAVAALVWACGSGPATPRPSTGSPTPTPWASGSPSAIPSQTAIPEPLFTTSFPVAVVVRYDDPRLTIAAADFNAALAAGKVVVPCEFTALALTGAALTIPATATCKPAASIAASIVAKSIAMALLPPGLVVPSVKVLEIGNADLFGGPNIRPLAYPLTAAGTVPASWAAYNQTNVRTLISTGDTCPDAGFAHLAVFQGKGWAWVLGGGTAHYRGTYMNTTYGGPAGKGWPVPLIARNGDTGKVDALISDNDVSANDFE